MIITSNFRLYNNVYPFSMIDYYLIYIIVRTREIPLFTNSEIKPIIVLKCAFTHLVILGLAQYFYYYKATSAVCFFVINFIQSFRIDKSLPPKGQKTFYIIQLNYFHSLFPPNQYAYFHPLTLYRYVGRKTYTLNIFNTQITI